MIVTHLMICDCLWWPQITQLCRSCKNLLNILLSQNNKLSVLILIKQINLSHLNRFLYNIWSVSEWMKCLNEQSEERVKSLLHAHVRHLITWILQACSKTWVDMSRLFFLRHEWLALVDQWEPISDSHLMKMIGSHWFSYELSLAQVLRKHLLPI